MVDLSLIMVYRFRKNREDVMSEKYQEKNESVQYGSDIVDALATVILLAVVVSTVSFWLYHA
jgi:hypothetical protein